METIERDLLNLSQEYNILVGKVSAYEFVSKENSVISKKLDLLL